MQGGEAMTPALRMERMDERRRCETARAAREAAMMCEARGRRHARMILGRRRSASGGITTITQRRGPCATRR